MKVAVITTLAHNVGDDFVREGIFHLFRQRFGSEALTFHPIHKHAPVTTRYGFEWVRSPRLSAVLDRLPVGLSRDRILEADLVVQSGAPVYWCNPVGGTHCGDNEWFRPLISRRHQKRTAQVPFLNLGAGACQRYHSDGSELAGCPKDAAYIRRIHEAAAVTTVRDPLAQDVLCSLGLEAPLLPCPSLFARDSLGVSSGKPSYVVMNYMRGGAHFRLGQTLEENRWFRTFRSFHETMAAKERVILACHDLEELEEARRLAPGAETFYSSNPADYARFYAEARFGILNRVHGAFMLASFGRPSFLVGNDSRVRTVETIGLTHAFVNDVDLDRLIAEYQRMEGAWERYAEPIGSIREKALGEYVSLLEDL